MVSASLSPCLLTGGPSVSVCALCTMQNWQSVEVPSLTLQSDTHANTPWPWDELTIDTLDIADLCKLPDPSGAEERMFFTSETILDAQCILQVRWRFDVHAPYPCELPCHTKDA